MSNPEKVQPNTAEQLTKAIDAKFEVWVSRRGGTVRDHEESLALVPTTPLSHCPTASRLYLERPIPEEADVASVKWPTFGGHRVTVFESGGQIQTDFLAREGKVFKRQTISYPGDFEPLQGEGEDERLLRRAEELLGDAMGLIVLSAVEREAEVRRGNVGEAISPQEVEELLGWISEALPEQP